MRGPKVIFENLGISNYFEKVSKYHEYTGIFWLTGQSFSSPFTAIIGFLLVISGVLTTFITFCGATTQFSTTSKINRTVNILSVIICMQNWLSTLHFIYKKREVQKMINWCKDVETGNISKLLKPRKNWFSVYCVKLLKLIKIGYVVIIFESLLMTVVFVTAYRLITGTYKLPTVYNLFGYPEVEYPVLFWIEFLIGFFGTPFLLMISIYEFPYFILFALYGKRQLEFICSFIRDVSKITDPVVIQHHLVECIRVHTNAMG